MAATAITRLALLALVIAPSLPADTVDLASVPLVSGVTKTVRPNVYFILDDSSSMNYDYMPDSVDDNDDRNCFRNFGYNKIYYNPTVKYPAPKRADGTSFDDSNTTFTSARSNGFSESSATVDLSATATQTVTEGVSEALRNNPFTTNGSRDVTVAHANHRFTNGASITISGAVQVSGITPNGTYTISNVTTNGYQIRVSGRANGSAVGGGASVVVSYSRSTTVNVPRYGWYEHIANPTAPPSTCAADSAYGWRWPTTADEKRNFTNWYSYYRTRLLTMKSATGRAFASVGSEFRVGYSAISEPGTSSKRFLKFGTFEGTHKADWYERLYAAGCPSGTCYTPLRGALTKAGRLYAGYLLTGNDDPVQYSCQQNFTILTTDGYWNTTDESPSGYAWYAARQMNGTTNVGDQDGTADKDGNVPPRPYYEKGKYANTLADIAYYYYNNDLRDGGPTSTNPNKTGGLNDDNSRIDVTENNVPQATMDDVTFQHMKTFTLGLGVSGTLAYSANYLDGGSEVYNNIKQGTENWPDPKTSNSSSTVTERIDDLWHAAVNGRGQYMSASGDPDALVSALTKTLTKISVTTGAAAAAATSTLEPVAGDNYAYLAKYTTGHWTGDLEALEINVETGALSKSPKWSARSKLSTRIQTNASTHVSTDTRTIYTYGGSTASKLKAFDATNLTEEIADGYFDTSRLTQHSLWDSTQRAAATATALIDFLRGHNGNEDEPKANGDPKDPRYRLFRDREYALGDIVNAAPVFVRKPPFSYADAGYAKFVADNQERAGTVYVGANDGMLHAFDADTGAERWAYVPTAVIPSLYRLADAAYANNHRYYVDGPIAVGDAYDPVDKEWKTILVGGLGNGGRAYYALDVTNPASPRALWEFGAAQDANLGYSYGNPMLTKRASDGRWVVLFASGYNNVDGDSKGRLFVVDAFTGESLDTIVTGTTAIANLSGIAKATNWVLNTLVDNTTQYVYGGDLAGVLWRFDLSSPASAVQLGSTSATAGNLPITARPEVARIKDGAGVYHRVVYFGTGRYLGLGDIATSAPSSSVRQGIFAVKDTGSDLGVLTSTGAALKEQTLDTSGKPRTISNPIEVDWQVDNGWYLRTPLRERMNVDLKLQLGTLVAIGNVPGEDYCVVGGQSWLYALDYRSGTAVTGLDVGYWQGNSISTGVQLVILPNHKMVALVTQADGTVVTRDVNRRSGVGAGVRRVSWREIF